MLHQTQHSQITYSETGPKLLSDDDDHDKCSGDVTTGDKYNEDAQHNEDGNLDENDPKLPAEKQMWI